MKVSVYRALLTYLAVMAHGSIRAQSPPNTSSPAVDLVGHLVTLVVGLAWPAALVILIWVFRKQVASILAQLDRRIERGATVSAMGVSIEGAPLPLAITTREGEPADVATLVDLLSLEAGTDVLVVLGEVSDDADESALVGSGDALGVALVQATLLHVPGVRVTAAVLRRNRKAARDFLRQYRVAVVLGGPSGNEIAKELMMSVPLNLEFQWDGVYDKATDARYRAKFTNQNMDGTDWGIVVIVGNPKREGRVALLAGHTGYGTNAAAAVFARIGQHKEFTRAHSFEALVRVDIVDGVVQVPEVVLVRRL